VFAAFAPVAGRVRPSVRPGVARPLFYVAGRLDHQVQFGAQQDAIDLAKRVNNAHLGNKSCGAGCTIFDTGEAPVVTWIHPGGHEYPRTASERIAKFFRDRTP
jgi:polyhydroxybutyrate depolymerase